MTSSACLLGTELSVFASAAALTLGAFTAPIYEVYKVGVDEPRWREGLNLLGRLGLNCAVIPHFDNNEGGNYDTRYCYLGEPRLLELEHQLPEGVATLGVDEHTAAILDFANDTLSVEGRSNVYWRLNGESRVFSNGTSTSLDELRTLGPSGSFSQTVAPPLPRSTPVELAEAAAEGGDEGLQALAQLVQLASKGGVGFIDPSELIEGVLRARVSARSNGQYEVADELRDALIRAGVEVKDGPEGTSWSLASS